MFHVRLLNCADVAVVDDRDRAVVSEFQWRCIESHPGYRYVTSKQKDGKTVYLHRLVMEASRNECVDHVNGNTLDNRRCNLRVCTHAQNMRNRRRSRASKFPYKGVSQRRPGAPFVAIIRLNKHKFHLGSFDSVEDAALAYDEAAVRLHGDFARLNFPERKKIYSD